MTRLKWRSFQIQFNQLHLRMHQSTCSRISTLHSSSCLHSDMETAGHTLMRTRMKRGRSTALAAIRMVLTAITTGTSTTEPIAGASLTELIALRVETRKTLAHRTGTLPPCLITNPGSMSLCNTNTPTTQLITTDLE